MDDVYILYVADQVSLELRNTEFDLFFRAYYYNCFNGTYFLFIFSYINYAVMSINELEYDESELIKYISESVQSFLPSSNLLSGFVSGSLFTLFFALCPIFSG